MIDQFQVGLEFNPVVDEIGPVATWFLMTERGQRPGLFLGTSSDRIGTPEGEQSYYATLIRQLPLPGPPVSGYVTLNYSDYDEGFNVPFGLRVEVPGSVSLRGMYDGQRTHAMATWSAGRWAISGLLVWLERPGLSLAFGW